MGNHWNTAVGIAGIALAVAALALWFPRDIAGDFTETTLTGRIQPGDAFYPTVLAVLLGLLGFLQMLSGIRSRATAQDEGRITLANLGFLGILVLLIGLSGLVCYGLGPALSEFFAGDRAYRVLRDTFPYKYFGFAMGGFVLLTPMIAIAERRLGWLNLAVTAAAILILIGIFGLALPNTQMPPNAEF